jgi:perosamine synthetase
MKVQRTIPPTAAPIKLQDVFHGILGLFHSQKYVKQLESEIKEFFGARHVFLVSSGKAALTLILVALQNLSKRKQVVIPAYTCFSLPSAIVKTGLEIALCDIDSTSLDFDYACLEEVITPETLCVIPHHLFGIPSDMQRIQVLCRARSAFILEDAVQAMGGQTTGRKLGMLGDVGFFSLGRGKPITCGSGGVIVTNSDDIAAAIARPYADLKEPSISEVLKDFFEFVLMSIFVHPRLYWLPTGLPFLKLGQTLFYRDFPIKRLSRRKAGLLRYWRRRLAQANQTRTEIAAYFGEQLHLKTVPETSIPYLRLPILVNSRRTRDRIYALSQQRGLGISCMYPSPINEIEEIKTTFDGKAYPAAKTVSEKLLTIPIHHLLSENDKKSICTLFEGAYLSELCSAQSIYKN